MSGTLKKNTSLRLAWSPEMESLLLDLWEEKIEDLRGSRKNSHVYQEIASSMQQVGFSGSWGDIRTKIDNMTRKYKQEKNKIGPTGGAPSGWCHYTKVNSILGSFKVHNVEIVMHESTDMSTLTDFVEFDPNSSRCSVIDEVCEPAKKRRVDSNSELVRLTQERMEMQKQHHEEKKEQVGEMLKRLDTIFSQNAAFQTELLKILKEKFN